MVRAYLVLMGASLVSCLGAVADSITVHGKTFSDVYVVESASRYYVQFPADGRVESYSKTEVPVSAVCVTPDPGRRAALLKEWKQSRDSRLGLSGTDRPDVDLAPAPVLKPAPSQGALRAAPASDASNSGSRMSEASGQIASVSLKEVPLRVALKAILRPMNLDYEVRDGIIWISSPRRPRQDAFEELETRIYELKNAGAETLPKIVVHNNGGRAGGTTMGSNSGQNAPSAGALSGSGAFQGAANGGSGGGAAAGGSAQFGNISQLFSSIDDRTVGEPPAVIGSQGMLAGRAAMNAGAPAPRTASWGGGSAIAGSGAGGSGTAQFSNISQLFSVIDDRLVGETPAYIGR